MCNFAWIFVSFEWIPVDFVHELEEFKLMFAVFVYGSADPEVQFWLMFPDVEMTVVFYTESVDLEVNFALKFADFELSFETDLM